MPKPWDYDYPGTNVILLRILNRQVGLSYDKNSKDLSVHLNHPLAKYWLSILEPIWEKQRRGKCQTCQGTGWDGETYTLSCMECGGSGKK